ncbi:MAG: sugar transferase [Candidatus Omnitrophica bacterium]|nr:sugar transferase [Candidatus Omnitrophota bacterium]
MLKEKEKLVRHGMMLLDGAVVALAFISAYFLRLHFRAFYKLDLIPSIKVMSSPVSFQLYLIVLIVCVPLWVLMLSFNGLYRPFRTRNFLEITWEIIKAAFFSILAFGSLAFVFKIQFVSRVFFIIFMVLCTGLLILEKWTLVSASRYLRKKGYNFRSILVVGTGPRAKRFVRMVQGHGEWGLRITGLIDDEPDKVGKDFFGIKVIGVLANVPKILRENVIDEVVFVVPRMWLDRIQETIAACETQGVRTSVAADLFELKVARAQQTDLNGFPLLSFETTFGQEWQLLAKRTFDLFSSFMGLLFLSPLLVLTGILVKITSRGPVLFKQKRLGVNGRIFTLFKFRTMYSDAEKELSKLEHLNEMDGPVFKIKSDPRITPLGKFLRRSSIDELPQLFNVLLGQMSIVGPRPPLPSEVNRYEHWQARRLSLRPGLTCLWQVNGRNKISFEQWVELDLKYIDNWSLWLDFKILMKTIPVVMLGVGAS